MDRSISLGLRRIGGRTITEKKETCAATACTRENKVGGVSNDIEDHVTGVVTNDRIRVGSKIIQEVVASLASDNGGLGLGAGDFVEGRKNRGVNSAGVV